MTEMQFKAAQAVWLHDHRLFIAPDPISTTTEVGLAGDGNPEYQITPGLRKLLTAFVVAASGDLTHFSTDDVMGFSRHYNWYSDDGSATITGLFICQVDGGIEIQVEAQDKHGEPWKERWSYRGAYTVMWKDME